jgi:hypothetical protein
MRNIMATLVSAWTNILTSAQRDAWDSYGGNTPMLNKLGDTVFAPGQAHYIRSNAAILQAGLTRVDAGPTVMGKPGTDPTFSVALSEATQQITVTFDDTLAWCDLDGAAMIISMGKPQSASRNFFGGPWRFADSIDGDSVTPPTSTSTVAVPFTITEGQKVFCRARIVLDDGRLSDFFRDDALVAA